MIEKLSLIDSQYYSRELDIVHMHILIVCRVYYMSRQYRTNLLYIVTILDRR